MKSAFVAPTVVLLAGFVVLGFAIYGYFAPDLVIDPAGRPKIVQVLPATVLGLILIAFGSAFLLRSGRDYLRGR
jgi:uncharacterized membrane protein YraQ (UPF0718 family)